MPSNIKISNKRWGEKIVLLDEEDYDRVTQYSWWIFHGGYRTFYACGGPPYVRIPMHRFILKLRFGDGKIVDHINWNGLDNRKENLRIVSRRENALNSPVGGTQMTIPSWQKWPPNCCETCVAWRRKPREKWMSEADQYVGTCTDPVSFDSGNETDSRYRCPCFKRQANL